MRSTKGTERGTKSTVGRRRQNDRLSRRKLEQLLSLNFTNATQLVTLTYTEQDKPYTYEWGTYRVNEWVRALRAACRASRAHCRYIYATEWRGAAGAIHRFVLEGARLTQVELAAIWPYGTVQATPVDLSSGWAALASWLLPGPFQAERTLAPCARSWTGSMGLRRATGQERSTSGHEAKKET